MGLFSSKKDDSSKDKGPSEYARDQMRRRVARDMGVSLAGLDAALARQEKGMQNSAKFLAWGRAIEDAHNTGQNCGQPGCGVCRRAGRQA
ncbi:hypothetical protein [Micromonospora carbonacea]|uniref:hypothetical protein n=1 Tax=Micromonospora carbonacea TaxID=47853 RepID=UPI0033CB3FFA